MLPQPSSIKSQPLHKRQQDAISTISNVTIYCCTSHKRPGGLPTDFIFPGAIHGQRVHRLSASGAQPPHMLPDQPPAHTPSAHVCCTSSAWQTRSNHWTTGSLASHAGDGLRGSSCTTQELQITTYRRRKAQLREDSCTSVI